MIVKVKAVAEEMGIGFLGIGFQPKWGLKDIPVMPKVLLIPLLIFSYMKSICLQTLLAKALKEEEKTR